MNNRMLLWVVRLLAVIIFCVAAVDLWAAWWYLWFGIHLPTREGQSVSSIYLDKISYLLFHTTFVLWYVLPILFGIVLFVLTFLRLPERK